MTSTPTFIPSDFFQKIEDGSIKLAVSIINSVASSVWTSFRPYLPYAIGIFLLISIWAVIKATFGRWGQLGSIIYHVFFLGILGLVIAIKGWEIIFDPIFDIIYLLAYRFSYLITGLILKSFIRRR